MSRETKERAAIRDLAALIQRIAQRCWPDLGTDESEDIQEHAHRIFMDFLPKVKKP